jgi:K+-sensing histidine kinase KdpD
MALKDILVHLDESNRSVVRLRLAADLARRHESRLVANYVRELTAAQRHAESAAELGLVPAITRPDESANSPIH